MEIPPRVRRRVKLVCRVLKHHGNTSACAEKRNSATTNTRQPWKYLRVCGEEAALSRPRAPSTEIPPRVRRRVFHAVFNFHDVGNTSACAEKRSR